MILLLIQYIENYVKAHCGGTLRNSEPFNSTIDPHICHNTRTKIIEAWFFVLPWQFIMLMDISFG